MPLNKFTCIVIDDLEPDIELFNRIIERHFNHTLEIIGSAESVKEGVELLKRNSPDIVFLDIEMPAENGFKFFEHIEGHTSEVIFLTGYKQYAIEANKYPAFDYLLKPVDHTKLKDALARFEKKRNSNTKQKPFEAIVSNYDYGTNIGLKVAFPSMNGYNMVLINSILYCEGDVNYTKVHFSDGKQLMLSRTLKEVEAILASPFFFRIHKSFLVNLNYIKSYSRIDKNVMLDNKETLPVSTRKNDVFISVLTKWRNKAGNIVEESV